jgi:hypothetical protein
MRHRNLNRNLNRNLHRNLHNPIWSCSKKRPSF